jgi:hypothetical protein
LTRTDKAREVFNALTERTKDCQSCLKAILVTEWQNNWGDCEDCWRAYYRLKLKDVAKYEARQERAKLIARVVSLGVLAMFLAILVGLAYQLVTGRYAI